jgi:hypothetical protein
LKGGKMGWRKKEEPIEEIKDTTNQEIEMIKRKLASLEQPVQQAQPVQIPQIQQMQPVQKKTERTEVVKELPVQPVRKYKDEEGNIVNLITIEEALALIVNS